MLAGHYSTFFSRCTKLVSDVHGPQCSMTSSWPERTLGTKLLLCRDLGYFYKKTKSELQLSLRTLEVEIEVGGVCRES